MRGLLWQTQTATGWLCFAAHFMDLDLLTVHPHALRVTHWPSAGHPHRPILFLSSWLRYLCLSCAISLALNGTLLSESGTRAKKNPFISFGLSRRPLLSFFSTYITSFSVTHESEFVGCIQQHKSPDTIRSNCMCRLQRVHLICLFPCQ